MIYTEVLHRRLDCRSMVLRFVCSFQLNEVGWTTTSTHVHAIVRIGYGGISYYDYEKAPILYEAASSWIAGFARQHEAASRLRSLVRNSKSRHIIA